jgi:hypothetical protein
MTIGSRVRQLLTLGASSNRSIKSNNAQRTDVYSVVRGTTVSFTNPTTIADSGNGLAIFAAGQDIEIFGTASNNRIYNVVTSSAGSLTVTPNVTTEAAGAEVLVRLV